MTRANRATAWKDNAELVAVLVKLRRVHGRILDATYGAGVMVRGIKAEALFTMDAAGRGADVAGDFTRPPFPPRAFDTVIYDPPYKLNGTPEPDPAGMDYRYGVHSYTDWHDRLVLIVEGIAGLAPLVAPQGHLLVKCMDQVVSGHMEWQTDIVTRAGEAAGLEKVERLDLLNDPREQPEGRDEVHAAANYSTMIVLRRPGRRNRAELARRDLAVAARARP